MKSRNHLENLINKMKPKERALTAINHSEPDRVPIDLAGTNADIDKRLKKHFGLSEDDPDCPGTHLGDYIGTYS